MDKKSKIALFLILLSGAALRVWGVNFGLPYQFHQDEPIIVNHALAYGTGDLNPHFFIIPPLTSYILFFFYGAYFLLMNISGYIRGAEAFAVSFFKDPTPFYIIGRVAIGLIPSIINIFLVYKLASSLFSKRAAIYSSLVMAFAFLNVINAHYIYTDNLLVTLTLLSYISMLKLLKEPSLTNYVLSGIFIGMAVATKYNAVLLIFPLILAYLFSSDKRVSGAKALVGIMVVPLVFAICNPYALLDWRFFISSITGRIMQGYMGWTHHIIYSLFEGLGALATVLGGIGLVLILKKDLKAGVILLSFPVIFYLHLVFRSQHYSRYVLVLIPFLSIGLGYIFYELFYGRCKSAKARFALISLSLITLLPGVAKSVMADILFTKEDTRVIAARWVQANIPPRTKIALDHQFFSPPLKQTSEQLANKQSIIDRQPELKGLKDKKLALQIKALDDNAAYNVYYIIEGNESAGQFLMFWPVIKDDLSALKAEGIEYVITSNMNMSGSMRDFDRRMFSVYRPVVQFSPYGYGVCRRSYDEIETTCIPITGKELFSRQRLGPCLTVYKIR